MNELGRARRPAPFGGRAMASYRGPDQKPRPLGGDDLLVVCDDLVATNQVTFQFMLHALQPFQFEEGGKRISLKGPKASAEIQYLASEHMAFRQWDGFDPAPEREFPNQWHLEAGTTNRLQAIQMLSVFVISRGEVPGAVPWSAERMESASAVGLRFVRGARTKLVAFRKAHQAGSAALGSLLFDRPVAVLDSQSP